MREYTVGEMAEGLRRPDEKVEAAIARLKNWTKEGLIAPFGAKNPGSGRARTYSLQAYRTATLIQAIVDGTGMPAVAAAEVVKSRAFQVKALIAKVSAGAAGTHLLIWRDYGSNDFALDWVTLAKAAQSIQKNDADVHFLLDMRKFYPMLKGEN